MFLAQVNHSRNYTRKSKANSIFNNFRGSIFLIDVVSFENAASRKYVVQKGKSLSRASSERVGYSFLVLIQKSHSLF